MKWKCKKDIILFENLLANKGDIVEIGQVLYYGPISLTIDDDFVKNEELFEPVQENFIIKTKEFQDDEEEVEKEWIIELKLTCSRKNLRKIESFLNSEVSKFL